VSINPIKLIVKINHHRSAWWYVCINPTTWEGEVGGSRSKASPEQKHMIFLKNKLKTKRLDQAPWLMPIILATWQAKIKRIGV
jgi:hypothetical protein